MSESVLIAAFGLVAVAIGGLYVLMHQHISQCRDVHAKLARIMEHLGMQE